MDQRYDQEQMSQFTHDPEENILEQEMPHCRSKRTVRCGLVGIAVTVKVTAACTRASKARGYARIEECSTAGSTAGMTAKELCDKEGIV
ncbi:hypothetical protein [Pasteuria penetrans]|uniref:hypothetical protein n=1 Tax=Pasteuria penetrans TaxID=86005 RepID=UPI001CAA61AE|nr:hypothetical protein [Pasteuria penetrans]